jgi:uncharacterized protein YjbJ (UPF0337 family)
MTCSGANSAPQDVQSAAFGVVSAGTRVLAEGENAMGLVNKLRNRLLMTAGSAKARYGRATGNRSLEVKARWQRIVAATRQVGEQLKDAGKNIRGGLKKQP